MFEDENDEEEEGIPPVSGQPLMKVDPS